MRINAHLVKLNLADRCRFDHLVRMSGQSPEDVAASIMRSSFERLGSNNPRKKLRRPSLEKLCR